MYEYTLAELREICQLRLQDLITKAGTVRHLGVMLGVPVSTVRGWVERGRISRSGARAVEEHPTLGEHFDAEYLRPDIKIYK